MASVVDTALNHHSLTITGLIIWRQLLFVYSGLNFLDLVLRQGAIENPPKTPFVMGLECAGEVEAVGENVDRFNVSNLL